MMRTEGYHAVVEVLQLHTSSSSGGGSGGQNCQAGLAAQYSVCTIVVWMLAQLSPPQLHTTHINEGLYTTNATATTSGINNHTIAAACSSTRIPAASLIDYATAFQLLLASVVFSDTNIPTYCAYSGKHNHHSNDNSNTKYVLINIHN